MLINGAHYLDRLLEIMRTASLYLARLAGLAILLAVAMVATEVVSRSLFGRSIGFSTEISGYILSLCVTWPLAHVLHCKGHIRIDVAYSLFPKMVKAFLDILALIVLAAISYILVNASLELVDVTFVQGDIANTPLETPLWIPKLLWAFGFAWFGLNTTALLLRVIVHLFARDYDKISRLIGSE